MAKLLLEQISNVSLTFSFILLKFGFLVDCLTLLLCNCNLLFLQQCRGRWKPSCMSAVGKPLTNSIVAKEFYVETVLLQLPL